MLNSNSVFIVGAGASCEANLPAGNELKEHIAKRVQLRFRDFGGLIDGDPAIVEALRRHVREVHGNSDINPYRRAGHQIAAAMPQANSIDSFIDAHEGDNGIKLCGKLGIVRSILGAEKDSHLYFDRRENRSRIDFKLLERTWYNKFSQLLFSGCNKGNLEQIFENVSIITFNYDRCIEFFLHGALQNYYAITENEASSLLNGLRVFHPYGVVGDLPRQNPNNAVDFGADLEGDRLLEVSQQIRTLSERVEEHEAVETMRDLIQSASSLIFLGFAFHEPNMNLLRPRSKTSVSKVFATTRGISDSDLGVVEQMLRQFIHKGLREADIFMKPGLKCADLFVEYSRRLGA